MVEIYRPVLILNYLNDIGDGDCHHVAVHWSLEIFKQIYTGLFRVIHKIVLKPQMFPEAILPLTMSEYFPIPMYIQ